MAVPHSPSPPPRSRVWELTAGSSLSYGPSHGHPCSSFSRFELSGDLGVCLSGSSITHWSTLFSEPASSPNLENGMGSVSWLLRMK